MINKLLLSSSHCLAVRLFNLCVSNLNQCRTTAKQHALTVSSKKPVKKLSRKTATVSRIENILYMLSKRCHDRVVNNASFTSLLCSVPSVSDSGTIVFLFAVLCHINYLAKFTMGTLFLNGKIHESTLGYYLVGEKRLNGHRNIL